MGSSKHSCFDSYTYIYTIRIILYSVFQGTVHLILYVRKDISNFLLTESAVITGKYQTEVRTQKTKV